MNDKLNGEEECKKQFTSVFFQSPLKLHIGKPDSSHGPKNKQAQIFKNKKYCKK